MPLLRLSLRLASMAGRYGGLFPSIAGRLHLLAVAAMLPLIGAGGINEYVNYRAQQAKLSQELVSLSRSMAATVRLELQTRIAALEVLAQSVHSETDDLTLFRAQLDRFLTLQPPGASVGLVAADGRVLLIAGLPDVAPAPQTRRFAMTATERVVKTGQPAVSDFYIGSYSHRPSFSIDVPIREDGVVRYDLSLNPGIGVIQNLLKNQRLPPSWTAIVVDSKGTVLARSRNPEAALGHPANNQTITNLLGDGREATFRTVSMEGTPILATVQRVDPFGWAVGISVPAAEIAAPLWNRLTTSVIVIIIAVSIALLLAHGIAQTISGPILALRRVAREPEPDHSAAYPNTGLCETDAVAGYLRDEAVRRQAAETALRALNQELEARVHDEVSAREAAQIRAARAERMQALGQLSGGIAHDFNNVLQAVVGSLSIIERRANDEQVVHRFAQIGLDTAKRGSAITGRLLAFARHSVLAAEPLAPASLLHELCTVLTPTLGAAIEVIIEVAPDLPRLAADRPQLETALINLAANSRDAMPDGGVLTLAANAEVVPTDAAHPAGLAPGRYVRLSVADTGTGIDPELLGRVMEPFFTTKEKGKGTGLGLSVVKGFAEQSRGGFAITSEPGRGTVASLWLPEAADKPSFSNPAGTSSASKSASMQGLRHILLVDDQRPVRDVLAAELAIQGYDVSQAPDGATALHLLDRGSPVDLLISDFSMPGMDGITLIREAQQRRPLLRAILLTGYAGESTALALDRLTGGAVSLVRKPVTGPQLADHAAVLLEEPLSV